jgi:DNA-binding NarL/FixJ family response regulator
MEIKTVKRLEVLAIQTGTCYEGLSEALGTLPGVSGVRKVDPISLPAMILDGDDARIYLICVCDNVDCAVDMCVRIIGTDPDAKVLFCGPRQTLSSKAAFDAGAMGHVTSCSFGELAYAIQLIMQGEQYSNPPELEDIVTLRKQQAVIRCTFTLVEKKICGSMAGGYSCKETAARLGLRGNTMNTHMNNIHNKPGLRGHSTLVHMLIRLSLRPEAE